MGKLISIESIQKMIFSETYIISDQPVTCPRCGNRTDFLSETKFSYKFHQLHKCLSGNCNYEFEMEEELLENEFDIL